MQGRTAFTFLEHASKQLKCHFTEEVVFKACNAILAGAAMPQKTSEVSKLSAQEVTSAKPGRSASQGHGVRQWPSEESDFHPEVLSALKFLKRARDELLGIFEQDVARRIGRKILAGHPMPRTLDDAKKLVDLDE